MEGNRPELGINQETPQDNINEGEPTVIEVTQEETRSPVNPDNVSKGVVLTPSVPINQPAESLPTTAIVNAAKPELAVVINEESIDHEPKGTDDVMALQEALGDEMDRAA